MMELSRVRIASPPAIIVVLNGVGVKVLYHHRVSTIEKDASLIIASALQGYNIVLLV